MKDIVTYPNPLLKTACSNINLEKEESLIKELKNSLYKHNAVGIAANQIGESKNLFLALDIKNDLCLIFANSEIVSTSKEQIIIKEGCLSFPKLFINVKRPQSVKLKFETIENNEIKNKICEFDGLTARIILHEFDHTKGVLFTEKRLFRYFK